MAKKCINEISNELIFGELQLLRKLLHKYENYLEMNLLDTSKEIQGEKSNEKSSKLLGKKRNQETKEKNEVNNNKPKIIECKGFLLEFPNLEENYLTIYNHFDQQFKNQITKLMVAYYRNTIYCYLKFKKKKLVTENGKLRKLCQYGEFFPQFLVLKVGGL